MVIDFTKEELANIRACIDFSYMISKIQESKVKEECPELTETVRKIAEDWEHLLKTFDAKTRYKYKDFTCRIMELGK